MGMVVGIASGCGSRFIWVIGEKGQVLDRFEGGMTSWGWLDWWRACKSMARRVRSRLLSNGPRVFWSTPWRRGLRGRADPSQCGEGQPSRYRAVLAKSDPGDAYIISDILCTDGHRPKPLKPQSDAIKALRGLVRGRDDLVATCTALAKQLTTLLDSCWPGAAVLFAGVAGPIALAFIERYPIPDAAARLGSKRLAGFLAQHHYCSRKSPEVLLMRRQAVPQGCVGEAES